LLVQKTPTVGTPGRGICNVLFLWMMVYSFALAVSTNGECMMCSGFSLSENIRLGSFEFIIDYFGGLSLSPRRSDSDTSFMGSTHSGPLYPRRALIDDSTDKFRMA
jgi:hypothetical protein